MILRRSRMSSRCLRWEATAARFSSVSIASLRRAGVARAQGRLEDLLEQRRLAVRRGAEHAQVAPADAVAGELGHGADDLALGLVVPLRAVALLALDDAVVLELGHELAVGAGLLEHVLEAEGRPALLDPHRGHAPPAGALARRGGQVGLGAPARELLADHPQGQELVALEAQDRAQPAQVLLRVEPVAAGRALGLQQLLVLEVADLRDRDVGELGLERLGHGPDRHGLAARGGRAIGGVGELDLWLEVWGHRHRVRKESLYLPIWSSSPSSRRTDSTRRRLT